MSGRKSGLGRGLGDLLADNAPELRGGATVVRRDESGEVTVTPHANDAKNSGSASEYATKTASERTSIGHGTAIGRNNDCIEIRSEAKTEVRSEERTGEEKENAVLIGDSHFDIECAKNANIVGIHAVWGRDFTQEEIKKIGGDFVAKTPNEIIEILERL